MSFNFIAKQIVSGKAYPALAQWDAEPFTAEWRMFTEQWPYTTPCELHEHCEEFGIPYQLYTLEDYPLQSFYSIGLGFFDFTIDYFSMLPGRVRSAVRRGECQILFYYHEGDNPYKIKSRLDELVNFWQLPEDAYRFVSGNTSASGLKNFVYFPDHELLYWRRNKDVAPCKIHTNPREYEFTVLSRTHKWWRATAMADLHRNNLLTNSYWSYGIQKTSTDHLRDNPLKLYDEHLRDYVFEFLSRAPYTCDTMNEEEHNNHGLLESSHFTNSYCHIVFETLMDADNSAGVFLTEKTFKPIKHGQPFIIVGNAGSLEMLRKLGYKTFDHAIDNSYDTITDNTERWCKILDTIKQIQSQDMHKWFESCVDDIKHNQQLFLSNKQTRLNMLLQNLNND